MDDTEKGMIKPERQVYGNKFIVAMVTGIHEEGYMPIEEAKSEIKKELIRRKKANMLDKDIREALAQANDLDALAAQLNVPVRSVDAVNFFTKEIPGIGEEPQLIAAAVNTEEQSVIGPINGKNGVYALSIENKNDQSTQFIDAQYVQYLRQLYKNWTYMHSLDALVKLAKVRDFRYKLY
jgi:peptidyl-prolyl cis-trans isomerase D